jgi:hypothetical protein
MAPDPIKGRLGNVVGGDHAGSGPVEVVVGLAWSELSNAYREALWQVGSDHP